VNHQKRCRYIGPYTVTGITSRNGAAGKLLSTNPLMVSLLEHGRVEMNMPIAEKQDADLNNVLTDNELDDVNGGFIWFIAAGAYLVGVGAVAGYYATKALLK
jgi:lactobin A/cerein 7B family class IIb bacteriocin